MKRYVIKEIPIVISINVSNVDVADIFVKMTDNNTQPPSQVMNGTRLNNQSNPVAVSIQEGGNGQGNVSWTANRTPPDTASKQGAATPSNFDTVPVTAV